MTESAGSLFRAYDENIDEKNLVEILTTGEEMKLITGGAREREWIGSEEATIERKIKAAGLADKQMKVIEELDGWRRRALGLLWAYIYRLDLGSEKLSNSMSPRPISLDPKITNVFQLNWMSPLLRLLSTRASMQLLLPIPIPSRSWPPCT